MGSAIFNESEHHNQLNTSKYNIKGFVLSEKFSTWSGKKNEKTEKRAEQAGDDPCRYWVILIGAVPVVTEGVEAVIK